MDFKSTIDLIIKDLNEASEIIDDLKKYPGVPALQVELAKSKCRSAGEVIALLKSLSYFEPAPEPAVSEQQKFHLAEKILAPEKIEKPEKAEKVEKVAPPVIPAPTTRKKEAEPQKKAADAGILADKFGHSSNFYDEQSAKIKAERDLSDHLKTKQITNLSEAIGISDKFLFISEIFNGNKDEYSQAILRLDKTENLQDAMAIIMSYTGENTENEAVIQLLDLVKLKFPSNE